MEVEPSIPNVAANQCKSSCDVGLLIKRIASIDDSVKYQILSKSWTCISHLQLPDFNFKKSQDSAVTDGPFSFLVLYEVQRGGVLCRYCFFFAQVEVDKGQYVKLRKLFAKPLSNGKNAIDLFSEHAGHDCLLAPTTRAQKFHIGLGKEEE